MTAFRFERFSVINCQQLNLLKKIMYVFNKSEINNKASSIQRPVFKDRTQFSVIRKKKKITKNNKIFLRSLGLKIQNASNY